MKRKSLLCIAALAAITPPAFAGDEAGHWYFTPQISRLWPDSNYGYPDQNTWATSLTFGRHLSSLHSLELNLNQGQLENPGALKLSGGSLDLLHVFGRGNSVAPFIGLGLGALEKNYDPGPFAVDAMGQISLGLFANISESPRGSFSLRPEIKGRWSDAGLGGHPFDYMAFIGFQFSFGRQLVSQEPAPAPLPPPPPPPPPAEPAPAPEAPPATPAAPLDTDQDGVIDADDKCPGTPRGVAVDKDGCPQKGSITLEGVTFEVNSAQLVGSSMPILDDVAVGLKKYPRLKVELQGHTDNTGSDQYNVALSQKRADSVRAYLISQGVPETQLTARGYGEGQPIADNSTAIGRSQNRRVVMMVLENPGDVEVQGEGKL